MRRAENKMEELGVRRQELEKRLGRRGSAEGILLVFVALAMAAQVPDKSVVGRDRSLQKGAVIDKRYALLNINNVSSWMRYDGHSNHSPSGDDGTYYPRSTGTVIYQDCLVWGGKAYKDAALSQPAPRQLVRVGGGTYGIGTRAGRIINPNLAPTAGVGIVDPNLPEVRAYRIRRDYHTMENWDLQQDAGSMFEINTSAATTNMMLEVKARYAQDWAEWPISDGAPFIDRNGNGMYDPPPAFNTDPNSGPIFSVDSLIPGGYDEPGVAGVDPSLPADQVIFTIYNDRNVATSLAFEGSEPLGLEVQKTMWGYRSATALGDLYFVRFKLINKGGVDSDTTAGDQFGTFWIDSMYVAQWSDPDLGNAGDDLIGCDTVLSLGYCYNANAIDAEFRGFNLPPPAVGYDFLGSAVVPSPGDSGIVGFQRRLNVRNLPMTSFAYFSAGSPYSDPPTDVGSYLQGTGRWWKMLRGFAPIGDLNSPDIPFEHPPGFPLSKFPFSGNPYNGEGWLDGRAYGTVDNLPGDRRVIMSSGPFTFAPGDTQEVYVGVVAGLGADRLSSIQVMKSNDQYVQSTFNRIFAVPRAPAQPRVNATALDRQIIIEWGSDAGAVHRTEKLPSGSLVFEGYNVVELPTATSPLSDGVHRQTFDVRNSVTRIMETVFEEYSGEPVLRVAQEGSDNGINRTVTITKTYLTDVTSGDPLINGKEYHFAVTAYNYNIVPGDLPRTMESEPVIVTVRPRIPFGESPVTAVGETLTVVHTSGSSDARVSPLIIDPLAGRGDTFRVSFQVVGSTPTWQLTNVSTGAVIVSGQTNLSGDGAYPIVDGALVKVVSEFGYGLKPGAWGLGNGSSFNQGSRHFSWAGGDSLQLEEFNGAAGWTAPSYLFGSSPTRPVLVTDLKQILLRFVRHDTSSAAAFSQFTDDTSSYAYRFLRQASLPAAQPSFGAWIVNPGSGWRFQDYRISMPLAAYNIDVNPPARLAVAFSENNTTNGLVDGYYWPGVISEMPGGSTNTANNGPMEWLFVLNSPYTGATSNPAWQDLLSDGTIPVMYTFTWNRRNKNPWFPPQEVQFTPVRTPSTDTYEFVIPGPRRTQTDVNAGIDRIGVYPNPYLAERTQVSSVMEQSVTFTNLPQRATLRIFNLAGHLVRTLYKDSPSQFFNWNLLNESGWVVASGMYICYVELPDLGQSKVLKLGVVIGERIPGGY